MFLTNNLIDRAKLLFQKDKELRAALYDIIGFYPHHLAYYKLALRHKSTNANTKKEKHEDNERLEYLGDAVLDATVGDIVYRHFKDEGEGFLTNTRSKIVQRSTLNRIAKESGLDGLILSRDKTSTHNSYMNGNAFEALVGAIYLDRGYDAAMYFMQHRILRRYLDIDNVAAKEENFKSKLIEWSQRHHLQLEFRLMEEQRENRTSPVFTTLIILEGVECERGRGYSKKESHQQAAKATLRQLHTNHRLVESIFVAKEERQQQEV